MATTYYVAKTGNDTTGNGSLALPWLTITKGVTVMAGGGTLNVLAGTYDEKFYCGVDRNIRSGSAGSPTIIKAYLGAAVIIQPTSASAIGCAVFDFAHDGLVVGIDQQYITLDGLEIDASIISAPFADRGWGIQIEDVAHHIRVVNCNIHGTKHLSNFIVDGSFNEVVNCLIHDSGTPDLTGIHHGIYVSGDSNTVQGCRIYNNTGYGIHNYNNGHGIGATADNNIFRENIVYGNGLNDPTVSAGILISSGTNNVAFNNVVFGNPVGIHIWDGSINGAAYNNTAHGNTIYGIEVSSSAPSGPVGTLLKNNISYGNGIDWFGDGSDTGTVAAGNLAVGIDPLFVNAASNNFHLKLTSPAIGTGVTLSFTTDIDGAFRTSPWDIGAYKLTTVYYADVVNGDNSNPGTSSEPFQTLSYGVTFLDPGFTLRLKSGTYAEVLNSSIPAGLPGYPVTIMADTGATPLIQPASGLWVIDFNATGQGYVVLDGLVIDAANTVAGGGIEIAANCHDVIIQNCEVKNAPAQGVNIGPDAYACQVLNCTIHDITGGSLNHAVYIAGKNCVVDGCTLYNGTGYGVHVYNGYSAPLVDPSHLHNWNADDNTVRNCTIHNFDQSGIILSQGSNGTAYNNVLYSNGLVNTVNLRIGLSAIDAKVYNNTLYGNLLFTDYGIYLDNTTVGTTLITNNIIYSHGSAIQDLSIDGALQTTNYFLYPGFVNIGIYDFHLINASPVKNAGTNLNAIFLLDKDGVGRGSVWDIGAYEFFGLAQKLVPRIIS